MKRKYFQLRQWLSINEITHAIPALRKPFILCYHQIDTEEFDAQLSALKQKFEVLSLPEFKNRLLAKASGAYCTITLDDCLEKDVVKAVAVCRKHNMPLTFFLPVRFSLENKALPGTKVQRALEEKTEFVLNGKSFRFSPKTLYAVKQKVHQYFNPANLTIREFEARVQEWFAENGFDEESIVRDADRILPLLKVKQISSDGLFSFQSHTYNHETLARCTPEEIDFELSESKRFLEQHTGKDVFAICYPYGSKETIGKKVLDTVFRYYSCGLTLIQGICSKNSDIYFLPRIGIYPGDDLIAFWGKIYHHMQMASLRRFR